MTPTRLLTVLALGLSAISLSLAPDPLLDTTQAIAREALDHGQAYDNLRELTAIGPRLSGSEGAARAVEWAKAKLESYGFDRVWLQPVTVPKWTRGDVERLAVLDKDAAPFELKITALGNSVGTDGAAAEHERSVRSNYIEAPVVEVHSLEDVQRLGVRVAGKIVFYNRPMDPTLDDTFEAYGRAVDQRSAGPRLAAQYGAVAALVRTLTTLSDDDHPHTGVTSYRNGKMIPAAAISTHGANVLSTALKARGGKLRVRLSLSARREGSVPSYNVIAELKGSEHPEEIVVVGGHLDSWDLAQGAHDDGAGVVQSIETLRVLKTLGLRPKRTVRAVLFMSEEFGGIGGNQYAEQAAQSGEKHVAALESDRGGFAPVGFSVQGSSQVAETVRGWARFLEPLHAGAVFENGESGTDVEPLVEQGAAGFGYVPESRHYFDFHHSALDRLEAVNPQELAGGAAAMAVFSFLAAEQGF